MTAEYEFYMNCYYGEMVEPTEYPKLENRAEMVINRLIRGKLDSFPYMSETNQTAVKNAICAQVEYMVLNGSDIIVSGETGTGFTVGKVSVNGSSSAKVGAASIVAPSALAFLEQTGLMNPSVPTFDRRWY